MIVKDISQIERKYVPAGAVSRRKKTWEHEMDVLTDQIYKTNRPKPRKVIIKLEQS